jgi:hypothetical protein
VPLLAYTARVSSRIRSAGATESAQELLPLMDALEDAVVALDCGTGVGHCATVLGLAPETDDCLRTSRESLARAAGRRSNRPPSAANTAATF